MSFNAIVNQLLRAGREMATQGQQAAERGLNLPQQGPERDAALGNMGKGAMAGGALALLLGTGSGRRLAGTAAAVGGLAALGGLAFKAYQNWQGDQQAEAAGTPVDRLTGGEAEQRSVALFKAMIAAAKSDGHIDDQERAQITRAIGELGLEPAEAQMIEAELARPVDAAEIAAGADSTAAASEVYLASLFVIDPDHPGERAYLDELAKHLELDPGLAAELERQAALAGSD